MAAPQYSPLNDVIGTTTVHEGGLWSYQGGGNWIQTGSTAEPTGDVLGATAPSSAPTEPTAEPTAPTEPAGPTPEEIEAQHLIDEQKAAIEGGYSGYFSQLDQMLNVGLPGQQTAQEGIATSQHEQGGADLLSQFTTGQELLGEQEQKTEKATAKTIKDISSNLKNAFMAGNVFLGSRGAGDSSAANQYSYALTKMGSKQRGDVQAQAADIMAEIGKRGSNLKRVYDEETNTIKRDFDQKISGIASWFAEQQNAIRQAQATGEISKGQDLASLSQNLLNQAIGEMNFIKTEQSNRRSALEQWAMSNATNIQQLRQNMGGITSPGLARVPGAQPIAGQPQVDAGGNIRTQGGYFPGSKEEEEKSSFGSGALGYRA